MISRSGPSPVPARAADVAHRISNLKFETTRLGACLAWDVKWTFRPRLQTIRRRVVSAVPEVSATGNQAGGQGKHDQCFGLCASGHSEPAQA